MFLVVFLFRATTLGTRALKSKRETKVTYLSCVCWVVCVCVCVCVRLFGEPPKTAIRYFPIFLFSYPLKSQRIRVAVPQTKRERETETGGNRFPGATVKRCDLSVFFLGEPFRGTVPSQERDRTVVFSSFLHGSKFVTSQSWCVARFLFGSSSPPRNGTVDGSF